MSNPESKEKEYNTVFMGPLTHRETRLDVLLNANKQVKWSEELENEYLERVKARATEKVRALLVQAKRRSDEIIHEAEKKAEEIVAHAKSIEQDTQNALAKAQHRYDEVYQEAVQNAQKEMQNILMQNQKSLGESTAIVLLSIHEQLGKFYDVWKEDLKQLTLNAIEVGTGWVASTEKEAILKQLLDESVQKLIERKNFIVRANPADTELITHVLENSREKNWSVESSKNLEPGSLEVESDNVFVKNSHAERVKFVQNILENLCMPASADEDLVKNKVKDTLSSEMRQNPVLAFTVDENSQGPLDVIPIEKIYPEQKQEAAPAQAAEEPALNGPDAENPALEEPAFDFGGNDEPASFDAPSAEPETDFADSHAPDTAMTDMPDMADFASEEPTAETAEADPFGGTGFDLPETDVQEQPADFAADTDFNADTDFPAGMTADPAEEPSFDMPAPGTEQEGNYKDMLFGNTPADDGGLPDFDDLPSPAETEADSLVEEFLGEKKDENQLPPDIADNLLAEMGFNEKQ